MGKFFHRSRWATPYALLTPGTASLVIKEHHDADVLHCVYPPTSATQQ